MGFHYAKGSHLWLPTHATNHFTNITIPFRCKAVRVTWIGIGSSTDADSETLQMQRGVGFATFTQKRAVGTESWDTAATSNCGAIYYDNCVAALTDGGGGETGRLDVGFSTVAGFSFIVRNPNSVLNGVTVHWEAWGGDDITVAQIIDITEPAATGTVNYSVTGLTSDGANQVLMFAGNQQTTAVNTATGTDSGLHVGWATGTASGDQVTVCGNADDASNAMDTDGYCQTGRCLSMIIIAGGNPSAEASLSAWGTDQFTLNWASRATTGRRTAVLALKGGKWKAGAYTINGNTGSATATVSGLSFRPIGASFIGRMTAQNTAATATANDRFGFGSADFQTTTGLADRQSMGVLDEDATGSSATEIDMSVRYAQCLVFPSTAGALQSAYDINAVNSDGFQIIVDTAGGVASEWQGYLTFGAGPAPWYPLPVQVGGVFREPSFGGWTRRKPRQVVMRWFVPSETGAASAAGVTLTDTVSLIAGSASGERNATANGVTLTPSVAILAGTATGDASAPGSTLTPSVALLAGVATGEVNGTANGALLTPSAAILAGSASGERNETAAGQTLTVTTAILAGTATVDGTANAATFTPSVALLAGTATGEATANGATLTPSVSLIAGSATGEASGTADGQTLTVTASIIAGAATGDATANGALLLPTVAILAGSATGEQNGTAAGVTFTPSVSLLAGTATGDASAAGATLTPSVQLIPGPATAGQDGEATGVTFTVTTSEIAGAAGGGAGGATFTPSAALLAGTATGDASQAGALLAPTVAILAGAASGESNGTAAGATLAPTVALLGGAATGDAAAGGQTITVTVSLIPGEATSGAVGPGATLPVQASLVPGTATGAATASGVTIGPSVSLVAGLAHVDGDAQGTTPVVTASIIPGAASGIRNPTADGAVLAPVVSLIPGSASGAAAATANGVTFEISVAALPGQATGGADVPGGLFTAAASLLGGAAFGEISVTQAGVTLTITTAMLAGGAEAAIIGITPGYTAAMTAVNRRAVLVAPDRSAAATNQTRRATRRTR